MTPKQLFELLQYIMENNSWNKLGETVSRNRLGIKYTDFTFDSRCGKVFSITFRQGGLHKEFTVDNQFDIEKNLRMVGYTIKGA